MSYVFVTTSANNWGIELENSVGEEMQLRARYKQHSYFTIVSWDIKQLKSSVLMVMQRKQKIHTPW